jgi:hypothetical protein
MVPCPVVFVIPVTMEASVLRLPSTRAASSHKIVWFAYYKKRGKQLCLQLLPGLMASCSIVVDVCLRL